MDQYLNKQGVIKLWNKIKVMNPGTSGGSGVEVVNNLESESTSAALSAKQGKVLNGLISNNKDDIISINEKLDYVIINLNFLSGDFKINYEIPNIRYDNPNIVGFTEKTYLILRNTPTNLNLTVNFSTKDFDVTPAKITIIDNNDNIVAEANNTKTLSTNFSINISEGMDTIKVQVLLESAYTSKSIEQEIPIYSKSPILYGFATNLSEIESTYKTCTTPYFYINDPAILIEDTSTKNNVYFYILLPVNLYQTAQSPSNLYVIYKNGTEMILFSCKEGYVLEINGVTYYACESPNTYSNNTSLSLTSQYATQN